MLGLFKPPMNLAIIADQLVAAQKAQQQELLEFLKVNFATRQELEERIDKSEAETDASLDEKFKLNMRGDYAKNRYWDKRTESDAKDTAILAKATSLGLPAAMGQMLLGRVKSELRAEYNSLTPEAIYDLSEEQLKGFIDRLMKPTAGAPTGIRLLG